MSTTKRIAILLATLLFCGAAIAASPADTAKALSVRTFTFKYKDAEKAAAVIKSLVSAEGSMSIQPANNALVVTDRPENLTKIGRKAVRRVRRDCDRELQSNLQLQTRAELRKYFRAEAVPHFGGNGAHEAQRPR